jgi:hypothetical protein
MKKHDPYGPILEELRIINGSKDGKIIFSRLRRLQPYVTDLRMKYRDCPSNVDFSCSSTRIAYLLTYYPHYIEPIYKILSKLKGKGIEKFLNKANLRVCFIGAGPAPEALGLAIFLQEHCPDTSCITGYIIDKYIDDWKQCLEFTRLRQGPQYWPNGKLTFEPLKFDCLNQSSLDDPKVIKAIQHSQLFVMQNCLNDLVGNSESTHEMVMHIFRLAPARALFIICDLNFCEVKDLIQRIQNSIHSENIGKILLSVQEQPEEFRSNIILPPLITENLLIGDREKKLISKEIVNIYYAVFQRNKENPF